MTANDVAPRLLDFLNREVSMIDETIELDTDLLLSGAVDSLGVIAITRWLEEEFSIVVDPTEIVLENFQFPSQTVAFCETKLA